MNHINQGVQFRCVVVVKIFIFLNKKICFGVVIIDLVHEVEALSSSLTTNNK